MNNWIYFDVDDTLVLWDVDPDNSIVVLDPWSGYKPTYTTLTPNKKIIQKLKEHSRNNDTVIVWSQAGHDWAFQVCEALNICQHVNYFMTKPTTYYDDLDCKVWMPERQKP